jgi:hypothetical protein
MHKSKYCCFYCPAKDYTEKSAEDPCPTCGRSYGMPIFHPPIEIKGYKIVRALQRGFYGAAYIAERGVLRSKCVIKITPKAFYPFFGKVDFEQECRLHARAAEGAQHIVGIRDAFEHDVVFGDSSQAPLPCYVVELEYVDGCPLREYLDGAQSASAAEITQVAIDLLAIRAELEQKGLNHNDLHAENLIVETLVPAARRLDATADSIRVKAIDLGSVGDASKSGDSRWGDLRWIADHIDKLIARLLANPDVVPDRDNRIALALQGVLGGISSPAANARTPAAGELIKQIRDAFDRALQPWKPWEDAMMLRSFGDHYNAQTLEPWHVPSLLVDPTGAWALEVTKPGPQIITGMRGCGKTLLLKSLDFHARAVPREAESNASIVTRLKSDGYMGLFTSAQRLLDLKEQSLLTIEHRLTKLLVYYGLQAVRAAIHLRDLDPSALLPTAHRLLAQGVGDFCEGQIDVAGAVSLDDLERRVERLAVRVARHHDVVTVRASPADVFSHLATQLRRCSDVWRDSTVLFLLDDVSTRHLDLEKVETLLSALLFSNAICAFKFTSEWQTIELGLRSPGRVHPIRIDRDVALFDLGAEVYRTISEHGHGSDFVERVLIHRAKHYATHPSGYTPTELLSDVPLEQVAREIASTDKTSRQRKEVYRGLSCLTSVCVGDLGDVIKLYEEILKRRGSDRSIPIPAAIQSECFQYLSSHRLYDLNRRAGYFKDNALTFAEASHELLVRSYRERDQTGRGRLRQYSSVYVRVTTEDPGSQKNQIDRLRELIDAGVFVFAGGAARTKTKDANPIQQFKLSYRKIIGLSNFIGLADRDRFELSGDDLQEWLDSPQRGKEILLRRLGGVAADQAHEETPVTDPEAQPQTVGQPPREGGQQSLFGVGATGGRSEATIKEVGRELTMSVRACSELELQNSSAGAILVGLGFEERTRFASDRLAAITKPARVVAIAYPHEGHGAEILATWRSRGIEPDVLAYSDASSDVPDLGPDGIVDVSGLSKPFIFAAIRRQILRYNRARIAHATAKTYFPRQEDLQGVLDAEHSEDPFLLLNRLADVLMGEKGPYELRRLLPEVSDESRKRVLLGFVSPKHERLFTLLDKREYDYVEVIAPEGDSPRSRVAQIAADVIGRGQLNARIDFIDTNDLSALIGHCDARYRRFYGAEGANFEVALTGSKLQAVAVAALSAKRKISQAWYVSPQEFDISRFTQGVGELRVYEISEVADGGS